MKKSLTTVFKRDPLAAMLDTQYEALIYFIRRDILEERAPPVETLWELPEVVRVVRKQQQDGSWNYPSAGKKKYQEFNYNLLETHRQLGIHVDMYGFNKNHPAV